MGIPRGRAKAALKRSKGDAMSAAERVFGGEFDDVPSEDEGSEDDQTGPSVTSQAVVERDDDEMFSDDGGAEENSDGENMQTSNDPYAGIFFSKDRVEKVIEAVEEEVTRKVRVGGTEYEVGVLGRGAWMSGCPENGEQQHLFQLYFRMEEPLACPHACDNMLQRDHRDFFSLFPDFQTYAKHLRSIIHQKCAKCKKTACLACGEKVDLSAARSEAVFRVDGPTAQLGKGVIEYDELLHCFELQGILIGVGLHMIERSFATSTMGGSSSESPPTKKRKKIPAASMASTSKGISTPDPEGDDDPDIGGMWGGPFPRGGRAAKGTGYAGVAFEDRTGQRRAEQAQAAADAKTGELLTQVRVYLPTLDRASGARSSDHLVHPTALAHLRRRSGFVTDLLRNDSLLDMVNRRNIYEVLFDWLKVVSSHESLASMLGMPQMRPAAVELDPDDPYAKHVTYEGSASPRELLESCVIQAQAALKGLAATRKVDTGDEDEMDEEGRTMSMAEKRAKETAAMLHRLDDENVQLEEFCNRIIISAENIDKSLKETKGADFVKRMRESLPGLPEVGRQQEILMKGTNEEATIKIYEDWVSRARFQYCDMTQRVGLSKAVEYHHAFNGRIMSIANTDAPKRSLAIAKELAILTRNMPIAWHSSIFLRVDETRVDVIKAMIIGPEGTPYENGCFIFDIFLPLDYNQKSPEVKSMTTNGGKYRYNPNLYADGKVCLSLLGTWQGPGWIAGQSTLLQVLISIQSLILCAEPYLNEPGWAGGAGTPQSKAYSANVRRMVLVDAMANNMRNPPRHFASEIKTHFRLKTDYIIQQLERWKTLDDGIAVAEDGSVLQSESRLSAAKAIFSGPSETPFEKAAKEVVRLLEGLAGQATADVKLEGADVGSGSGAGRAGKPSRKKK